jgi:hypothetical protein
MNTLDKMQYMKCRVWGTYSYHCGLNDETAEACRGPFAAVCEENYGELR